MNGQGTSASSGFLNALTGASVFPTDVLKSVQLMPGVSNTDDSRSSIRIRGANDEATLLLLDEMPVYKADHFYGIFSSFNSRYITTGLLRGGGVGRPGAATKRQQGGGVMSNAILVVMITRQTRMRVAASGSG